MISPSWITRSDVANDQVREMRQTLNNAAIARYWCLCSIWYSEHRWYFRLTWKLYKILFDSQRFASCNIYYLKTYASTECLKQTSTLQTFTFIMNWMKYHVVSSFVTYGSFFVSARGIKNYKYNSPKLFFCYSIYRKPFFRWFYMKEHHWQCTTEIIPPLPKTALLTAQSSFTKSNDGTVTAHHVPFAREKCLISLTSV